jgi:geranylgeranyl pyrophosphate synthase
LKPHKQTTIFTLLGLRKSQRDIERITGIDRKTNHFIDAACAQALAHGVHSYSHVKAVTERLVADALEALQPSAIAAHAEQALTQQHELIRSAQEYGDLFAHAASTTATTQAPTQQGQQP